MQQQQQHSMISGHACTAWLHWLVASSRGGRQAAAACMAAASACVHECIGQQCACPPCIQACVCMPVLHMCLEAEYLQSVLGSDRHSNHRLNSDTTILLLRCLHGILNIIVPPFNHLGHPQGAMDGFFDDVLVFPGACAFDFVLLNFER